MIQINILSHIRIHIGNGNRNLTKGLAYTIVIILPWNINSLSLVALNTDSRDIQQATDCKKNYYKRLFLIKE